MSLRRSLVFIVAVLPLLVWAGCGSSSDEGDRGGRWGGRGGDGTTPSVEAVQARYGALPLEERMSGTVYARNQVEIYPQIGAPVTAVEVETGEYVEKGQALVRLQSDVYRQRVRQAEASLRIARAEAKGAKADLDELRAQLERAERLGEKEFQSEQEIESLRAQVAGAEAAYEQAEGQVEQAEATLDERRADLSRTVIRAPISGHVGRRNVQVGQRVGPDTRIFTMGNLETVRVEVGVTDRMMGRIEPGQTARISAPSLDSVISAEVTRISPFINNTTYSAEAEIDVPNPSGLLRAGMFVQVDVAYGESQQATIVPLSAIYEDPSTGSRGVFVAPTLGEEVPVETPDDYNPEDPPSLTQPTPTEFREVDIIAEGAQTAGIRGVEPGDWIVTVGQNLLSTRAEERVDARVRPMTWPRLMALQRLQDTDLLRDIMEQQRQAARERFGRTATAADTTQNGTPDASSAPTRDTPANASEDPPTDSTTASPSSSMLSTSVKNEV